MHCAKISSSKWIELLVLLGIGVLNLLLLAAAVPPLSQLKLVLLAYQPLQGLEPAAGVVAIPAIFAP